MSSVATVPLPFISSNVLFVSIRLCSSEILKRLKVWQQKQLMSSTGSDHYPLAKGGYDHEHFYLCILKV